MFQQSKRTLTILVTAVALVWGALSLPALGKGPPRGGGGGKTKEEDTTPPAAVNTLVVLSVTSSSVELGWFAVADDTGDPAAYYDIRYSTTPILTDEDFNSANLVHCDPVPAAPGQPEIVTVGDLSELTEYDFALKVADAAGNWSDLSNVVFDTTVVTEEGEWAFEVVDPLRGPGFFGSLALAYNAGNPSIAYNYTESVPNSSAQIHHMQFARWDGAGWERSRSDCAGRRKQGMQDPCGRVTPPG